MRGKQTTRLGEKYTSPEPILIRMTHQTVSSLWTLKCGQKQLSWQKLWDFKKKKKPQKSSKAFKTEAGVFQKDDFIHNIHNKFLEGHNCLINLRWAISCVLPLAHYIFCAVKTPTMERKKQCPEHLHYDPTMQCGKTAIVQVMQHNDTILFCRGTWVWTQP